jgi:hypothetical protein
MSTLFTISCQKLKVEETAWYQSESGWKGEGVCIGVAWHRLSVQAGLRGKGPVPSVRGKESKEGVYMWALTGK